MGIEQTEALSSECKKRSLSNLIFSLCIISASIAVVYFQVHSFDFINFDDNVYITENRYVLSGLNSESLSWAFATTLGGHWHPLTWLSLMLDVSLWGVNPGAMHLGNAAFHLCNTLLLFFLLLQLTGKNWVARIAALIFGLHPLRMESVAWVSQRKDLLSLNLSLITALLYFYYIRKRALFIYFLSIFTFFLSLLAKSTMMTFPLLLIVAEVAMCLMQHKEWAHLRKLSAHLNKLPYFIISIVIVSLALFSQSAGGGLRSIDEVPLSDRINMIFPGYVAYLGKLFWPFDTALFYPITHYPSGLAFGCGLSLILLCLWFWQLRFRAPELLLAAIWFLIALLPMIGLVPIGAQALADRWTLLAHIGPIVALTNLAERYCNSRIKLLFIPLIILLACSTFLQLQFWQNSESIFRKALAVNPDNFLAHTNLGAALTDPVNFRERVFHFEEAVRLNPTYPEALNNLGTVRAQEGRFIEAKQLFENAVSRNPGLVSAQNNLAQVEIDLRRQGNLGN